MSGITRSCWQTEAWVNWNGESHPLPAHKVRLALHGCIQLTLICSAGVNQSLQVLHYLTGG